jgi:hypothetical protein
VDTTIAGMVLVSSPDSVVVVALRGVLRSWFSRIRCKKVTAGLGSLDGGFIVGGNLHPLARAGKLPPAGQGR